MTNLKDNMKTTHKDINYHVWTGENLAAKCYHDLQMPDGSRVQGEIGKINIVAGDVLSVDYGRSLMVYTRSGKGYKAEFPYGKVTLSGTPVFAVLDGNNKEQISLVTCTQDEFNASVKKQQKRIEPEMTALIKIFIIDAMDKKKKQKEDAVVQNKKQKEIVSEALEKMKVFFKPSKNI